MLTAASASAQNAEHNDPAMEMGSAGHIGGFVMPFDLARSTHVFTPAADGGTQDVVSRDGDPVQLGLIRGHLRREAEAFGRGDYADPAAIHGQGMPGLARLRAGAAKVAVRYDDLPDGARLRFTSIEPDLVAALHDWFAAQVRDHGPDATTRP